MPTHALRFVVQRCLRAFVIVTLVVPTCGVARSAVAAPDPASPSAADEPHQLARSLFDQGLAAYTDQDFPEASRWWSLAYDAMSGNPDLEAARHVLALDLGQAHFKAYTQGRNQADLENARRHLQEYVGWIDRAGHFPSHEELEDRARAQDQLASIVVMEAHPRSSPAEPSLAGESPSILDASPRKQKPAKPLIVSGAVFLSLAIVSGVAAPILAVQVRRAEERYVECDLLYSYDPSCAADAVRRGSAFSAAMLGTVVSSITLAVVGTPLLAVGLVRRRHNLRLQPTATFHQTGLTLSGRF